MDALSAAPGLPANRDHNLKNGETYSTGEKQKRTDVINGEQKSTDHPKQNAPWGWTAYKFGLFPFLFVASLFVVLVLVLVLVFELEMERSFKMIEHFL